MRNKYLGFTKERETEPFDSAEEAWFWYCRCEQMGTNRPLNSKTTVARPCETSDIFLTLKGLFRKGICICPCSGRFGDRIPFHRPG